MVTLVGAGPGAYGLMTLKGTQKLMAADVVIYDRLVGDEIISMLPERAEKIDVGKNAGSHPVPQEEINALILEKSAHGANVVRLKGGDSFVFGRGGEELAFLAENGVEFEVVPGVSSATAAGAYAGIPVTHRDYASSLHIISAHYKKGRQGKLDYGVLSKLDGTLVFMMGVCALREVCEGLMRAGTKRDMPAAVIENASLNSQRVFVGTVSELPDIAEKNSVTSPAVIIVGKVCGLSDKLSWFSPCLKGDNGQPLPLFGKKVAVTRAEYGGSVLTDKLKALGCEVLETPCTRIIPMIKGNSDLERTVKNIDGYGWLVFTSVVGVNMFFDYLSDAGVDIRKLWRLKIAAVGARTGAALKKRGFVADYIPTARDGVSLAKGLVPLVDSGCRLLIARSKIGSRGLTDVFEKNNLAFDDVAVYDVVFEESRDIKAGEQLLKGKIDVVAFTSSAAVEGFVKAFPDVALKSISAVCIGERTYKTAEKHGMRAVVCDESSFDSVVEKIKEILL